MFNRLKALSKPILAQHQPGCLAGFAEEAATVCDLYAEAPALHEAGVHMVSSDEKSEFRPWSASILRYR
jgi:hypothetical protein